MDPKLTHMFHVPCSSSFVVRPSRVSGTFRFSSQVSIYDSFYDSLASKGAASFLDAKALVTSLAKGPASYLNDDGEGDDDDDDGSQDIN